MEIGGGALMATVALVCRSGGEYGPEHVEKLGRQVAGFSPPSTRIEVLDDARLVHGWPGWWSKIELFRPGLFPEGERVVFLDLDTLVLAPLTPLLESSGVVVLKDWFLDSPSSALMTWTAGTLDHVYSEFRACPDPMDARHKVDYRQKVYGDQSWLHRCLAGRRYAYAQELWPGFVIRFAACRYVRPAHAAVVTFAAGHRPWSVEGWARKYYEAV